MLAIEWAATADLDLLLSSGFAWGVPELARCHHSPSLVEAWGAAQRILASSGRNPNPTNSSHSLPHANTSPLRPLKRVHHFQESHCTLKKSLPRARPPAVPCGGETKSQCLQGYQLLFRRATLHVRTPPPRPPAPGPVLNKCAQPASRPWAHPEQMRATGLPPLGPS